MCVFIIKYYYYLPFFTYVSSLQLYFSMTNSNLDITTENSLPVDDVITKTHEMNICDMRSVCNETKSINHLRATAVPAGTAERVLAVAILSVRLSVRLSRPGTGLSPGAILKNKD